MNLHNIKSALEVLHEDLADDLKQIEWLATLPDESFCNYVGSNILHDSSDVCSSLAKRLIVIADLLKDAAAIAPPVDTAAQMADDLADPLGDDEDISPEDVVIVGADLAEAEFVGEVDDESDNDHAFVNRDIGGQHDGT